MFRFFRRKDICPISEEDRIWMENSFLWLMTQFGEDKIRNLPPLLPIYEHFPVALNQEAGVDKVVEIIAFQMDIDPTEIKIEYYTDNHLEIEGDFGFTLIAQPSETSSFSSGKYMGKKADGKYLIQIETSQFKDIERLVATLAHEFAHIKILGGGLLKINDEYLTDLSTVFFGLGVFNANAAFKFISNSAGWSYYTQGYLTQKEWGYALALYSFIRQEKKPPWVQYLSKNIQSDLLQSNAFIYSNLDRILI